MMTVKEPNKIYVVKHVERIKRLRELRKVHKVLVPSKYLEEK